jgi:hypothetical protein
MGAVVVVIANVIAKKSLQMVLVQSDDVGEHIAAAASDPALGNPVLPRAVDRGLQALRVHGTNGSRNFQPILLVVIKEEESGSGLIGEGLA